MHSFIELIHLSRKRKDVKSYKELRRAWDSLGPGLGYSLRAWGSNRP